MTTTTSFIAEHTRGTRKIFDTPDACLFEELRALRDDLIAAVTFLHFVDGVSIDAQLDQLHPKLKKLREKGREWEAARAARKDEFAQRAEADNAAQEAYWAQCYANQERIARAINRDIARRAQRDADTSTSSVTAAAFPERIASPEPAAPPEPVEGNDARPTCDICGRTMVRRLNKTKRSWFLACSGYPACKHTRPLADPAETSAETPEDMRRAA